MNQMKPNSTSLRMFFVMFFIAFPVFVTVNLVYRNSSFGLFEGFSEGKEHRGTTQNVTTLQNVTHDNLGREGDSNSVSSKLGGGVKELQERSQSHKGRTKNITAAHGGSRTASLRSSTNDSNSHIANLDDNEKLLSGLLTSGFDEASCISRMQSHFYRKASPHKPSQYLISKLRRYEEIHRRCGPNSRSYHKSMTKIQHSKNKGVATMCKYLIWTPANGLGNQMIDLVATFLYALLTDRVLLVEFGKDKHGLFCEPFLNSTWELPQNSPFWNEKHVQTYQILLEKDKATNSTAELPSVLFINLQHTRTDPEKFFHCDHNQHVLQNIPLLILQSDQYFVPSLFMNPFFNLEITKMFPEKDIVFHHLGRYLFHPSNEAWELISSYYQQHLAKGNELIGLQIRVFSPNTTPQKSIMDLVLSCMLKHKILPEVDLQTLASSARKNQRVKVVLVASLHGEYGENLRAMYLKKHTVSGEVIQVYQSSHEEHQKSYDNKHNMKAWIDMYLLSLSDKLVTTSLSTFGYVAQGLGNLKPWLLYRLINNETGFPSCEKDFSSEPCYHVPPKHYCNGNPMKDFVSSFPYLRECKDFRFGVKMVNNSI
ncbi:putative fucosyltransferase 10 isoform X1 [Phaseolus vulgaris]|uniref:putative fucosyltransferase 10 isoform X1 n=1 Tax=Phaseolus vulgaris TaxID=3885 RepID=UPI0035CBE27B